MVSDRAFLFLFHRSDGILLLHTTRKKSKGPHYQVPGGHVEDEDFDSAGKPKLMYQKWSLNNAGEDDTLLPYKICATRELYEETGIDLRNSMDRLKPVQLRSPKANELQCEYKHRIFFSAQLTDQDLDHVHAGKSSKTGLTQAMNKIPPNIMLKLSEEHQGFMFERNLSKAAESLTLHSGGKVSTALRMAVENGQLSSFITQPLNDEESPEGENRETPIQCNKVIKRELDMSPCKETVPHDCHRTFYLYLPQIVCLDGKSSNETVDEIGTLPVTFVVHCYGCNSESVMTSFLPYANTHKSIIVAPEGIQRSFNALDCCGYALSSKIDDVGFFSEILVTLEKEFSYVRSSFSYAVGWSNGGFMVMNAGHLFKAISPISGYIVDFDGLKANATVGKGIFFHHSLDDPFVRSTGCCNDPDTPACCCGIFAERCVSIQDVMKNFATEVNNCNIGEGHSKSDVRLEESFVDTQRGITCFTSSSRSCVANNTICLYEHSGHFNIPSFGVAFPMVEQVMDFFARDACEINSGLWNNQRKECVCRRESGYGGTYCFDRVGYAGPTNEKSTMQLSDVEVVVSSWWRPIYKAAILIIVVAVLCVFRLRMDRRKLKDEDEISSESGEKVELVDSTTRRGL
ncbi:hypothetical protein HJC23_000687 [Cyclotella cryptica]|uniref:Nudix hydrolase domain-containing protein n=1 Tax=Cyclotella cryptica TaxID=29204 RepID=A0ABD3QAK3_9STRA|eukprot:CCRYP_007367-RA/>CCRYP_007367-RA protein AED:0.21 eAED:0.21 QI:0/0.83/0.85/1/0.5/0.42/7/3696/628